MGLATHLFVGLVSLIVSLTYLKKSQWNRPRPVLVLITYAGMGLGRGLIISTTALVTEIPASPDFLGRAISSLWVFLFWTSVLTLVFESSERFRGLLADLDMKLEEIASIRAMREKELASVRADFLGQVTRILAPALDRARDAIDLELLANTLIEPSSYAMLQARLRSSAVLRKQAAGLKLSVMIRQAFSVRSPAASIATLATAALALPVIYKGGLPGVLLLVAVVLSLFVSIRLMSFPRRFKLFVHLLAVAAILTGDMVLAASFDSQIDLGEVSLLSLTTGMWIVALFLMFLHSLDYHRNEMAKRLAKRVRELVVVQAKLQQELALERMELTQLVHSEVQGRLRAAAVLAKTTSLPVDLQRLKDECIQAMSSGHRSQSMDDFLDELQLMWTPGLELETEINETARSALETDSYLRKAFQAIVREGIINAVKHGEAKSVTILVSMPTPDALTLEVRNDGKRPRGSRRGLGSQLLDELTTAWTLTSQGPQTCLRALLPVLVN